MKDDYTTNCHTTSCTHFLFRVWENVLFELGSKRVEEAAKTLVSHAVPLLDFFCVSYCMKDARKPLMKSHLSSQKKNPYCFQLWHWSPVGPLLGHKIVAINVVVGLWGFLIRKLLITRKWAVMRS